MNGKIAQKEEMMRWYKIVCTKSRRQVFWRVGNDKRGKTVHDGLSDYFWQNYASLT